MNSENGFIRLLIKTILGEMRYNNNFLDLIVLTVAIACRVKLFEPLIKGFLIELFLRIDVFLHCFYILSKFCVRNTFVVIAIKFLE